VDHEMAADYSEILHSLSGKTRAFEPTKNLERS